MQNDLPERKQDSDRWYRQIMARNKKSVAHKLNMSFKRNQLHIQNKPYSKKAPAPSAKALLGMTAEERAEVQTAKVVNSTKKTEKRNNFYGYAAPVQNISEVCALYKHFKLKHADATHVTMAHMIEGARPELQDYDDDGETGAGRRIVEWLRTEQVQNTVVFIVRYHSGQNLGNRRFELILEIVAELIENIKSDDSYIVSKLKPAGARVQLKTRVNKRARGRSPRTRGGAMFARGKSTQMIPSPLATINHTAQEYVTPPTDYAASSEMDSWEGGDKSQE